VRLGFQNVIDAFHMVNQGEIPVRFYIDERKQGGRIRLTQELLELIRRGQAINLPSETEARWRLVETAWELGISRHLLTVGYDEQTEGLVTERIGRRVDITSCRDALNGYQKGKCFYCYDEIFISDIAPVIAEIDHFIPHMLKGFMSYNLDGVWNLVLACRECNRGQDGKFARIPTLQLLERLYTRNEYLISSHHPLRGTLILQTGASEKERRAFLQNTHTQAHERLIHVWEPEPKGTATF
jgi:5-methylcytosine-specific restriction endonuclease McrA